YFPFEGRIFSAFGLGADAIALAGKASPYAVSAALSAVIFNMITGVDRRVVSLRDVRNEVRSGRVSPQGSVVVEIVSPLPEGSNRPVPMRSGCCHSSITLIPGLIRIGSLSVGCGLSIAMGLGAQLGLKGLWIGRFVGESVSAIFIGARTWTIIKFLLKQQGANAERVASTLLTQNPVNEIGDGLGGEIPVAQRAGEDLGEIYHVLNGGHIGDSQPKSPLVELSDLNGQKSTANAVFPVEHKADESELPKVVSQRFSGTIQKPIAASPAPATPLSSHLRTPPAPKTPTLTPGRRNLLPESSPNLLDLGAPASQPTVVIPVVRSAFAVVLGRGDSSQSDDEGGSLGPLTTRPSRVQAVARTLFFKEEDVQNVSGETSHGAAESYVALSPVQGGVLLPEEQGYTRFLTPNRPATGGHGPSSGSGSENSALGPSAVPFSVSPS
ncbi:MAG: hypothetical protein EBX40_03070, partial [Gammaproteobacteria bacterium]|nr:hypothetical protein [Gammaproteobacteria bacterium]